MYNIPSYVIPGLSDQKPILIVAHGLLFGSFLLSRSPWASISRKYCYEVLERNCQIKAHGPVFRRPWYWRFVRKLAKIIAIQVVKKHKTSNTLQILLSVYSLVHQTYSYTFFTVSGLRSFKCACLPIHTSAT